MASSINVQTFTASGTYTPTTGMVSCIVVCVGGGGGGADSTATDEASGGGGGGSTAIKCFQAANIGASKAVTVGAQVASETNGNTSGFGAANALLQATGGTCDLTGTGAFSVILSCAAGLSGTATLGDLNITGAPGGRGIIFSGVNGMGGDGGASKLGGGGASGGNNATGLIGGAYGGGGGGANATATGNIAGGAGAAGVVYIIELIDTGSTPTVDMWMGSSITQPMLAAKPPVFSQSRTITFTEIQPVEQWADTEAKLLPNPPRYPVRNSRAFVTEAQLTVWTERATPDKWLPSLGEVRRPPRVMRDASAIYQLPIAPVEIVTSDKWIPPATKQPWSIRLFRPDEFVLGRTAFAEAAVSDKWIGAAFRIPSPLKLKIDLAAASNWPISSETITRDKWAPVTAEVRRSKVWPFFANARLPVFTDVTVTEGPITLDKWRGSGQLVQRQQRLKDVSYFQSRTIGFIEEFIPDISLDKWRGNDLVERKGNVVYYNQARTIGFVEEFAPEGPITLDKWIGSQGDARRRVPKPRGTAPLTEFSIPFVPSEAFTLDKWFGSRGEVVRLKPRLYFANPRAMVFTDVTQQPGGTGGFDQYSPMFRLPIKAAWISRYRSVQYAVEVPAEGAITLDKWLGNERLIRALRQPLSNRNIIIPFFGASQETSTLDKWYGSTGRVITPLRPSYQREWVNYGKPTTFAEAINLDKWIGSGSLMRGPRYPLFDRNIIISFFGGSQETSTLDKWLGSTGQVLRFPRPSYQREWTNYGKPTTFNEVTSLDKWLGSGSLMRGPRYPLFDRNIIVPFFGQEFITLEKWFGSTGRIIIPGKRSSSNELTVYGVPADFLNLANPDKWIGSQGRIVIPIRRSASNELTVLPQNTLFGESATLDKWIGSQGRIIIPGKRSASNELSIYGLPESFVEIVTIDKWIGSQGRIIRPTWRSLSKELAVLPQNILFGEAAALDKWIGSAGRMIDTRRVVRRDPNAQTQVPIEPLTFDKWIGSQGRIVIPTRRSASRELLTFSKPSQFNEIISMDKWESVWNHLVIRAARPPLIVDLYGHTLIPRANAATGRLEIYYVMADNRIYMVHRRPGSDGDDDRIFIVTPPQE